MKKDNQKKSRIYIDTAAGEMIIDYIIVPAVILTDHFIIFTDNIKKI